MQRLITEIVDRDNQKIARSLDIDQFAHGLRLAINGSPNSLDIMLIDGKLVVTFHNVKDESVSPWAFNIAEKEVKLNLEPPASHWDEDPEYSSEDWMIEAGNNDTRLGYTDWCKHKRISAEDEPAEDEAE